MEVWDFVCTFAPELMNVVINVETLGEGLAELAVLAVLEGLEVLEALEKLEELGLSRGLH